MISANVQWINTDSLNLKAETPAFQSSSSVGELIMLIIIFLLVIAACYYVTRFIGNKQTKQLRDSNFTVIDTCRVTANKFLQLIQVGEKYLVIAVTKDTITVVTEMSKEEIHVPEKTQGTETSFKNVLTDLVNKKKNNGKG